MAPRRGGRIRGGGVSVYCSGDAYSSNYSRTYIAFVAVFFLVEVIVAFLVPNPKKRARLNGGKPPAGKARWMALRLCIWLDMVSLIIDATSFTISECQSSSYRTFLSLIIVELWLFGATRLLLWGVILITICRQMHRISGNILPELVRIGHSVYLACLALVLVVYLAVSTAYNDIRLSSSDYYDRMDLADSLLKAARGLSVSLDVLVIIGMLMAGTSMAIALSRSSKLITGGLKIWSFLLITGAMGQAVVRLAGSLLQVIYGGEKTNPSGALARQFIAHFCYPLAFVAAVYILKNPHMLAGRAVPSHEAAVAGPVDPPCAGDVPPPMGVNSSPPPYNTTSPSPTHQGYGPYHNQNPTTSNPGYQGVSYTPVPAPYTQTYYHQG
ncbi:hypothetical protein VTO42DRAFT_3908 [Malbranchea cinnamomea]